MFSDVVGVRSIKTYSFLESPVVAVDTINMTFNILIRSRDITFGMRRSLQQVVMRLPMSRHVCLKGVIPAIPFDVLQKNQPFL